METSTSPTPLTEARIQTIRNDILDSLLANRKQTPTEMIAETRRISRRRKASVQQVAGVRAAMSRGVYGNISALLRNRRKAVSAS